MQWIKNKFNMTIVLIGTLCCFIIYLLFITNIRLKTLEQKIDKLYYTVMETVLELHNRK